MKATLLYRIAGILLIAIAAGNTYFGVLRFWQVARSMNPLYYPLGHTHITYLQVVVGLQISCSMCILFGAYLAWHLGDLARTDPTAIGALGWILFAYELAGVVLSFNFFAGPVRILAVSVAVCTGSASWLSTVRRKAEQGLALQ
jgi:hypothetical protein